MRTITLTKKARVFIFFWIALFVLYTPLTPNTRIIETEEQLRNILDGFPIPFMRADFVTDGSGEWSIPDSIYLWGVKVGDYGAPLDKSSLRKHVEHLPRDYGISWTGDMRYEYMIFQPLFYVHRIIGWLYLLNIIICYAVFELSIRIWNKYAKR